MPSLKDLRTRIASVKATQKITKAMQMVAAAKLRRAQNAVEAARPYAAKMSDVIGQIAAGVGNSPDAPKLLLGTGENNRHLLVVCTAERGLCGGFNSSIAKLAREHANRLIAEGKDVKFLFVGRKGYEAMKRQYEERIVDVVELRVRNIGYDNAEAIGQRIVALFDSGNYDVVTLFYSQFRSVISQVPTAKRIIPAEVGNANAASSTGGALYEYEPSEEEILVRLLPQNISVQVFQALLENAASEQGARMSSMDNATRNAGDMIKGLTLTYNRARQAMITKELIEIISGAEAL